MTIENKAKPVIELDNDRADRRSVVVETVAIDVAEQIAAKNNFAKAEIKRQIVLRQKKPARARTMITFT